MPVMRSLREDAYRITIVSGFNRSGTSLVMKILDRSGLTCVVDNPTRMELGAFLYQDFSVFDRLKYDGTEYCIKAQHPWLLALPYEARGHVLYYRVIWMRRHPIEQAKSRFKVLKNIGHPNFARQKQKKRDAWIHSVAQQKNRVEREILASMPETAIYRGGWLVVDFERLLTDTESVRGELSKFLGIPVDTSCVIDRPVESDKFDGLYGELERRP